jgi:SulP family sulfate permease
MLIVRLRQMPFIDATGIRTLEDVVSKLRKRGVHVAICEANERVLAKLRKARVVGTTDAVPYHDELITAVRETAA